MLSLRRFIVVLLIIAVFSTGLGLLPSPLSLNATAISCDDAMKQCKVYWKAADLACSTFGADSAVCAAAKLEAYLYCAYLLLTCVD